MVALVVLSCLGAWAVSHDCLVVVITVFAALGVIMLMTPSGRDILVVGGFGLSAKLKRKS